MNFTLPAPLRYKYRELRRTICVGDQVSFTDGYNRHCTGWVKSIGLSPFYNEELLGILRAYVIVEETDDSEATMKGDAVATYCTAGELTLVKAGYRVFEMEAIE